MADWRALNRRARRQLGLFTAADARACGFDGPAVTRLCRRGIVERLHRGVYAIAGTPDSWERRVLAAHLRVRDSIVSHACAAYLDGLIDRRPSRIELTVGRSSTTDLTGVTIHRPTLAVGDDVVQRGPFTITAPLRSLRDLACSGHDITAAFDAALRLGRTTVPDAGRWVADLPRSPGNAALRRVIERAPTGLDAARSVYESAAYRLLRGAGIDAELNWPAVGASGQRYLLDLACPSAWAAWELDSRAWHSSPGQRAADARRQRDLEAAGWTVGRFDNASITADPAAFIAAVLRDLAPDCGRR